MENFSDYSFYINTAYVVAAVSLGLLTIFVVAKFLRLKNRLKNEK